jgi:hypothetical protein
MRCIFPYRSGAQYSLLRKHRSSQARRQHLPMRLCLGSLTPQRGHVQPSHRQYSSIHQIRQRSCFLSLDRIVLSRLSIQVPSAAPASLRQVMMDLRLARKVRQAQYRPRMDLLEDFSAGEDRRIPPGLQAPPPGMLKAGLGTAAVSPQRQPHRVEIPQALSVQQHRRTHQRLQAIPRKLLKALLRAPAISPQRLLH